MRAWLPGATAEPAETGVRSAKPSRGSLQGTAAWVRAPPPPAQGWLESQDGCLADRAHFRGKETKASCSIHAAHSLLNCLSSCPWGVSLETRSQNPSSIKAEVSKDRWGQELKHVAQGLRLAKGRLLLPALMSGFLPHVLIPSSDDFLSWGPNGLNVWELGGPSLKPDSISLTS